MRWSVGEGTVRDKQAGITLVQNVIIGYRWIACSYLGSDTPPPILTPAFLFQAKLLPTLAIRTMRPEHRPDKCMTTHSPVNERRPN